MSRHRASRYLLALACSLAAGQAAAAPAPCPRPFTVPLAPIGISVVVSGAKVGGIYPRLLDTIRARTGCPFKLSLVPRARLEAMFEAGQADILMPATGTPRRDRYGVFVPMLATRAVLISTDHRRAPVRSLQELLARRELRVALVRGNDYGDNYEAAVKQLAAQGRAFMEVDPLRVARLLHNGLADVTIMTPTSFTAVLKEDARVRDMLGKLRLETLHELPWHESGVYISRTSVSAAERAMLVSQLRAAYQSNAVWEQFKRYYPLEVVAISARPR
ncbi:MAG TPA: hypothetical protein VFG03_04270 [Telluria sp.]|nr:hypothetical protein [Telluria sp.]